MITRWLRRFALAELAAGFVIFHAYGAWAQSQETINERVSIGIDDLRVRVRTVENADIPSRLRVLEADMSEVKWLGRSLALAVASQLVIAGISVKDRRRN